MLLSFQESLSKLGRLSAAKLDQTSRRIRADLAGAEWKMGVCLLATVRTGGFRTLGYATISEYGEKVLNLSGKKLSWLLGAARALENLPLLSEAFQRGKIGWGKIRSIQSLATPETEREWLDFALAHSTEAVARKVALSPREWKRHRALDASLESRPVVSAKDVKEVLETEPASCGVAAVRSDSACEVRSFSPHSVALEQSQASEQEGTTSPPEPPMPPQKIRIVVELTPDQYALYEEAESRVRAQTGKRVSRAEVVTRMAEAVLNQGTSRARAKHQVLIHTCESCQKAWYDTGKGVQVVSEEVLEVALQEAKPLKVAVDVVDEPSPPRSQAHLVVDNPPGDLRVDSKVLPQTTGRAHIPTATLRALFARAAHRCERCGNKGGRLDIHHSTPVSEGGGNSLQELRLYCVACHTLHHEDDMAQKPVWRRAKQAAMTKARSS